MIMRNHLAAAVAAGTALALAACGSGGSVGIAGSPALYTSASSSPALAIVSDYETFASVRAISRASQLVLRGTVIDKPKPADRASQKGGEPSNDMPSVVFRIKVAEIYKGSAPEEILVIQPDQTRVTVEKRTPLTPNEEVVLFLNDPGVMFEGLPVHATYGADQGYVSLVGESGKVRPVTHLDPLPVPATLIALEAQIRSAGRLPGS